MCHKLSTPSTQPFSAQPEALSQLSNEELNTALVAQTAPLDACLELLVHRLRPIIINASKGYLPVLSWDYSDALQEARILLWTLITWNRFKSDGKVMWMGCAKGVENCVDPCDEGSAQSEDRRSRSCGSEARPCLQAM